MRIFFLTILIASILSIYYIKIELKREIDNTNRAVFEFDKFQTYIISNAGTNLILNAQSGEFFQKKMKIYDANISKFESGNRENIAFKEAILENSILNFKNALYSKNSNFFIRADDLNYSLENNLSNSNQEFELSYFDKNFQEHSFVGEGFEYRDGMFSANRIKANLELR